MPSMREHYNTDGIRISTTAISFFLHHFPHASPTTCFGCFFCVFMGENWMTKMPENWEITDIDESLAGCSGEVIDLEDTLFAKIDGRSFILGVRDLPVYIRKRYSRTKQTVHGQKRRKYKTGTLDKWLPKLYENVKAGWRCSCA